MGVSTDAKLIYGFEVGKSEGDADNSRCDELMDEHYATLTKVEKRLGAELVWHCSDECQMYIIGLTDTYVYAYRGHPQEINPKMFERDRRLMDAELIDIAEALGVKAKPGRWLLASYWG
jgi:hypothetical protein